MRLSTFAVLAPCAVLFAGSGEVAAQAYPSEAGVKLTHVPYKGAAPGTLSVIMGETSFAIPALTHAIAGKLVTDAVEFP